MSRCLEAFFNASSEIFNEKSVEEIVSGLDAVPQPAAVDDTTYQIFYSGTNNNAICTMQGGQLSPVQAIAFHNGLVLATGSLDTVERTVPDLSTAVKRDIGEQCILPGFVEPHLHIFLSALLKGGYFVDCDPLRVTNSDFEGVVQALTAAKQKLSHGQWLLGYGYDPSRMALSNGQFQDFTVDLFEKYNLNDVPIMIINASGHLGYANQTALTQAHITKDTPVEGGGFYVMGSDNQPNGICVEPSSYKPLLKRAFFKNIGRYNLITQGLTGIVQEWNSKGFTTVFDAGVGGSGKGSEAVLLGHLASKSSLNIAGAAANLNPGDAAWVVGPFPMPPGGRKFGGLTIKTIKLWMDGSTQGFTAALSTQYTQDHFPSYLLPNKNGWARWRLPEPSPIQPNPPDDIYGEMEKWASRGYQLMVHVNGDLASSVVLDAYAKLFNNYPDTQKRLNRLEHFTVTNPAQVKTAASLNLGVSHTIGHVCYWGDTFEQNILGQARALYIDPVQDDTSATPQPLCYSFNSDSPVTKADALQYIRTAVTRLTYPGQNTLGTQMVGLAAAIAGVTINPAKQILMDDTIGSLEPGKNADFVILNNDIQTVAAQDINTLTVMETWWKGNKVYTHSN